MEPGVNHTVCPSRAVNLSPQACAKGQGLCVKERASAWGAFHRPPPMRGCLPPMPDPCHILHQHRVQPQHDAGQLSCPGSCSLMRGPHSLCLSSQGSLLPPAPPQKTSALSPRFQRRKPCLSDSRSWSCQVEPKLSSLPPCGAGWGGRANTASPPPPQDSGTPQALTGNPTAEYGCTPPCPIHLPQPPPPASQLSSLSCPPFLSRPGLNSIWLLPIFKPHHRAKTLPGRIPKGLNQDLLLHTGGT